MNVRALQTYFEGNVMQQGKTYQICVRCVMDTSDPEIYFSAAGVCNHCTHFDHIKKTQWFPNEEGQKKLEKITEKIREAGRGNDYDCILGLSGGADSSYLALHVKKTLKLRPLAVHVDGGWNSETAVRNIELIVKTLDLDLITYVLNWEEMKDLQLAFMKASLPNQDIPQDYAFFASLYHLAKEKKIRYILSGSNYSTESILPHAWGYDAMDLSHIRAVHKEFGTLKLDSFPTLSVFEHYISNRIFKKYHVIKPLNYMPYVKVEAIQLLIDSIGWRDYGNKHHESRFTKFFQTYYLPIKFGFDKRRAHLSSLIVSGQVTREFALQELEKLPYDANEIQADKEFVIKKLGITEHSFDMIFNLTKKSHDDYRNCGKLVRTLLKVKAKIEEIWP